MYRIDKGFITEEAAREQYNSFYQQLRTIVLAQNDLVNRSKGIKADIDYLSLIRQMYHDKRFVLVESIKDFELKEHDGVIRKDHLYLRGDKLMKKIRMVDPTVDFDDVLKNLKMHNALKPGNGSNSRQLNHGRRSVRFYVIRLAKLR